ncbi:tRNA modification GTPase [Aeoliella sp. SH292]|uniref:tRNA modification GTPase n=1 Tax=Aeoliella sp. SH292 TaxID=3454464 RepID=UPI003F957B85
MELDDTIVAIASASGGAARGVVRITGPNAVAIAEKLVAKSLPVKDGAPTTCAIAVRFDHGRELPATLFVWPSTRSFARQPTVEIHTVGSPPLLSLVVQRAMQAGARLAQPGEFTLRAFLAGRIDLTQAEAVLGVIDAGSDSALQTALKQLAGGMATPLAELREELLILLADLEAGLDFADEDIEFISAEMLQSRLLSISQVVEQLVEQVIHRRVADELPRVVLAGPVNAGKSSLFNALVREYGATSQLAKAIESPEPGATRDTLHAPIRVAQVDCLLVDTAGIEDLAGPDSPRTHAQDMRRTAYENAKLIVECREASSGEFPSGPDARVLQILTKVDRTSSMSTRPSDSMATSATTGQGLDRLAVAIAERLGDQIGDLVPSTAERSRGSLQSAMGALSAALELVSGGESEELVAAELRIALDELGQVAGAVYTDDVLDRVFSRFCIGK